MDKTSVLHDARCFNEHDVVMRNPSKCCNIITKLLYILTCTGDNFSSSEASDVFFSVTKLFESKDLNLRRMVYLFIKEVRVLRSFCQVTVFQSISMICFCSCLLNMLLHHYLLNLSMLFSTGCRSYCCRGSHYRSSKFNEGYAKQCRSLQGQ
jgi:hypothetical protein